MKLKSIKCRINGKQSCVARKDEGWAICAGRENDVPYGVPADAYLQHVRKYTTELLNNATQPGCGLLVL